MRDFIVIARTTLLTLSSAYSLTSRTYTKKADFVSAMSLQAFPVELIKLIGENLCYMDLKSFRQTERRMSEIFNKQSVHPPDRLAYTVEAAKLANLNLGPPIPFRPLSKALNNLEQGIRYSLESALGCCFQRDYESFLVPTPQATTFIHRSTIPLEDLHLSLLMKPCRYTGEFEKVHLYQYYIWELSCYVYVPWSQLSSAGRHNHPWDYLWNRLVWLQMWDLNYIEAFRRDIALAQRIRGEERETERASRQGRACFRWMWHPQ
ncbi:MAG: hypothetical protein HETSPECPRED_000068 [Heterodermia speciosa]|uniref:F-box domain-containing protein n=1 Tax=Heterodermia speciosa TaxID=116794 RepID=A0A8H3EC81_9LECA|nr:MAG: hypothetical protein HETSPECPRED_000068 [Heterodermia speciosa]